MQNFSKNNIKKQLQEDARNKREMTVKLRGWLLFSLSNILSTTVYDSGQQLRGAPGSVLRKSKMKKKSFVFSISSPCAE